MKDLVTLALELIEAQKTIQGQQKIIEDQKTRISELEKKLATALRSEKRQATPFAKPKESHKKNPKKPGRKKGQGRFRHRQTPDQIHRSLEADLTQCPFCSNTGLHNFATHENYQIDIPHIQPFVTQFITQSAQCSCCQCRVQSSHPDQLSTAAGAANVCLGPRVLAMAADMHEHMGVSYEKIADFLSHIFAFTVTRSSLCRALDRLLKKAQGIYEQLIDWVRKSAVIHADETGWKVGTLNAWLWVFTNTQLTVYTIRAGEGARGHQVAIDILGGSFKGVLVSDCFCVYDVEAMQNWIKQKCLAHLLKDLKNMKESGKAAILAFASEITALLKKAIELKDQKEHIDESSYNQQSKNIDKQLDRLIKKYDGISDDDATRFLNRLKKQRPHLLTFLKHDYVEPTNNQAERMLRPGVVARKTQGCNKNEKGALKHAVLASILTTLRQQKISVIQFLEKLQLSQYPLPTIFPEPIPPT